MRPLFAALPVLIAVVLSAQDTVEPAEQPPKGDLSIRGSVVDGTTRAPIRRALVHANCANGGFAALSDGSGSFEITGLLRGFCEINAEKPGYVAQSDMDSIQLERSRNDVVVTMTPGAMVTGRAVDNAGDPVERAWVQAFQSHVILGKRRMGMRYGAFTNDLGRYRLTGLDPGQWFLRVSPIPDTRKQAGLQSSAPPPGVAWEPIYYGGATSEKTAAPIKLSAATTFEADFTVALEPGYSITGKLEGFLPNQDADVQLLRTVDNDNIASAVYNFSTGRFSIRDVPPGSYYLRATSGSEGNRVRAFQTVEVSGDIRNLTLSLLPGTDIRGELHGTLKESPNLRVPAGCMLSLRPETNDPDATNTYSTRAEPGKEFVFEHVLPDRYHLDIRCLMGGWVRSATYGETDTLRQSMTVGGGGQSLKIELGDQSGEVSGTVRDANGVPTAAMVILIPEDGAPALQTVALRGRGFQFANVPPGRYHAYAWMAKMQPEYENPDYVRNYSEHGRDVSVEGDGKATVDLDLISEESK